MNYCKKSIYPLFESLALEGRRILNLPYHQLRFEQSFKAFYGSPPTYDLISAVQQLPLPAGSARYKLRIRYNRFRTQAEILHYRPNHPKTLKLLEHPGINYGLKWANRSDLEKLYASKGNCDDILLCFKGFIQDCSYANIALLQAGRWFTPNTPLLPGTKRAQLLDAGLLEEREIHKQDLRHYEGFQLLNALLTFDPDFSEPTEHIRREHK